MRRGAQSVAAGGGQIWVITESADDSANRAATTILLPAEY
jgi:hypothetical protein